MVLLATLGAWAGYQFVERYYVDRELEAAARRAAPYITSLVSALERYQNITPILSEDQEIVEAALGSPSGGLNERLQRFAESTGADAVYLMDNNGWTIAASNWREAKTFLGQNYGFRPYFKGALSGQPSEYFAVGATTGQPGYFVAHPVQSDEAATVGVVAVKVDLRSVEANLKTPEGTVFVTNEQGVIVLSGRTPWRYRTLAALDDTVRKQIATRRQFGEADLSPIDISHSGQVATIGASRFVEHKASIGRLGWNLHFLSPYERVQERSRLVLAIAAVALSLLLAFALFRRSERIRGLLVTSQNERDLLNQLNRDLEHEVEERKAAETRLRDAQRELKQTSKLAALGQLAASVSHELGQPLTAMKTYIAGAKLPEPDEVQNVTEAPEVLGRLDRLVDRMSETTRQLKFFARRGGEALTNIDLADVLSGALETMRPTLQKEAVVLDVQVPTQSIIVRGGHMRLEQVLINLLRNAVDAMHAQDVKQINITVYQVEHSVRLSVQDTGEGLSTEHETNIFEPFVTTKASGEGMGLGLAISAGIVKEHGGTLTARNLQGGGAEFVLELPLPEQNQHAEG